MKTLVVGGGGREHAIIKKLKEGKENLEIYAAPGNGGITADAVCVPIKATALNEIAEFAVAQKMDFVIVAPDDPLVLGLVDLLESKGIPCFGPSKAAAVIEGSKAFSKELMKKYNIPTAGYEVFDDVQKAMAYIDACKAYPVVIKADGLALGKGVVIAQDCSEAQAALQAMMADKVFGSSGDRVVVEEFLTGPEVSVLAFTDGKTLCPMVSSMDHKRALDDNQGLNTGGMGTVAPNPYYTEKIAKEAMERIFLPTMRAMNSEGRKFKGCLYFGLMLTKDGPKVIEYNCRFGDPETQVVLPLLQTDLMEIMQAVSQEKLSEIDIQWKDGSAVCVVLASGGYPSAYQTGFVIEGLDENGQLPDAFVYHAGTRIEDGKLVTAGGRVLGVTAMANTLKQAIADAYRAADNISFEGLHRRSDIGKSALAAKE